MLKILIIEDEPFAQEELKRLLVNSGITHTVLDCLDSVEDSVEWLNSTNHADVIFCDIQLADGLSFEIFKQIKVTTPVIFTTAFDAYAIEAFKVNSVDYLLKPIAQNALEAALHKLQDIKQEYSQKPNILANKHLEDLLEMMQNTNTYKTRVLVKWADQFKFIPVVDIAYFYAEDNEVLLMTFEKRKYVIDYSLDQLFTLLNPELFFRLNRGVLANKESIGKIHRYFNSRLKIELNPEATGEVLVSRVKVSDFLTWMEQ